MLSQTASTHLVKVRARLGSKGTDLCNVALERVAQSVDYVDSRAFWPRNAPDDMNRRLAPRGIEACSRGTHIRHCTASDGAGGQAPISSAMHREEEIVIVVHLLPVDAWDAQQSLGHAFVVALDDVPRDEPRADQIGRAHV